MSANYDGEPETIGEARRFATGFLARVVADHGVPVGDRRADAVRLIVSELVTNAVKYAPGPCVLDLELHGTTVVILVWDTEPALPFAHHHDPARIGRHGLEVVTALSDEVEIRPRPVGKCVVVRIGLADQ